MDNFKNKFLNFYYDLMSHPLISIIIRVASLYGLHKKNFLKNFINTIKKNGEISAIYDQKITLTNRTKKKAENLNFDNVFASSILKIYNLD